MVSICRLWRGEIPLANAFWIWAVAGGLLVNVTTSLLFLALLANDRPVLAFLAGYAPSLPYNFIVSVGVWRSAAHYAGDPRWADLARITTVAGMVLLSVT